MNIIDTGINGLILIKTDVFRDERGVFFESYNVKKFKDAGIYHNFVQDNVSESKKGVLRGLHYQLEPASQTKLLTVLSGTILDVAVDLRKGSPAFGKYFSAELSFENNIMILIPKGFAHGFVTLSDKAVISYKCDNFYSPAHERGIRYDDSRLKINWEISAGDMIITDRDLSFPGLENAEINFKYEL